MFDPLKSVSATKRFTFEASHHLEGHGGKCANQHGHSYKLEITVTRGSDCFAVETSGPAEGMVMDFSKLSEIVDDLILSKLDHANLDEVFDFRPTAENTAVYIFRALSETLKPMNCKVKLIRLYETEKCYVDIEGFV